MTTSIVIGICTRLRNPQLRRLLESLATQPVPTGWSVHILIVDNNDAPAAANACTDVALPFPISFHHEPQAGLVHARNRALDLAQDRKADWFIGLDDDEWVSVDWLHHFTNALADGRGLQMWMGPCQLIFAPNASRFLTRNTPSSVAAGESPRVMTTQNYAIHRAVFDGATGAGLRFHMAFNETGGEDLEFFLRGVRHHGFRAGWVPQAIVFENRDGARATLRYRLFRTMRNQISSLRIDHLHQQEGLHGTRSGNLAHALVLIIRSSIACIIGLITGASMMITDRDRGMQRIGKALQSGMKGVAVLRFALGLVPIAYGKSKSPT